MLTIVRQILFKICTKHPKIIVHYLKERIPESAAHISAYVWLRSIPANEHAAVALTCKAHIAEHDIERERPALYAKGS